MALLKRLSDSFWSYVSPSKTSVTKTTSQTVPKRKRPAAAPRYNSIEDVVQHSRSMSPVERVDSWRVGSSSSPVRGSNKRKRTVTPIAALKRRGRPRKALKMEDEEMDVDMEYSPEVQDDGDLVMDEQSEHEESEADEEEADDVDEISNSMSAFRVKKSVSPKGYVYEESEAEIDNTVVISEEEYERSVPHRHMKIITPTTEHFARGVSTEELRAEGWDDDHITLVQKIAMRGFEPLMPRYWKFDYQFMPDSLFAEDDDAFVSSARNDHFRATKALEELTYLGGWVRDRVFLKGRIKPEQQVRRHVQAYIKWAEADAGLNTKTAIPLLAVVTAPLETEADVIKEKARKRLAKLVERYRGAFRVLQSIENSPGSRTSTQLSYPIPTLYAIIASHTLIALAAYKPDDPDPDIKTVAFFDMKDRDYDVWNSLALAIVVCHVRNVQLRIAEETGVGLKQAGDQESVESSDPDA